MTFMVQPCVARAAHDHIRVCCVQLGSNRPPSHCRVCLETDEPIGCSGTRGQRYGLRTKGSLGDSGPEDKRHNRRTCGQCKCISQL